jgi:hypothetical protein
MAEKETGRRRPTRLELDPSPTSLARARAVANSENGLELIGPEVRRQLARVRCRSLALDLLERCKAVRAA